MERLERRKMKKVGIFLLIILFPLLSYAQATLPISRTNWSSTPTGWTDSYQGETYANGSAKLDGSGQETYVQFTGTPGSLEYTLYGYATGSWQGVFKVQESSNGSDWSDLRVINSDGAIGGSATDFSDNPNGGTSYIKFIYVTKTNGNVGIYSVDLSEGGSSPIITLSESSISGFTYEVGNGPSAEQSFTVSGSNLEDDISLAAPTNYEISKTSGSGYTTPLTLTQSGGSVAETTIYVRLKAGLSINDYNNEDITASSSGATSKTVTCSGSVTADLPDIIISEIMQNPSAVSDSDGEWFEIYNAGSSTVNIDGWTMTDESSDSHTIDNGGTLNITAGGFLVLGNNSNSAENGNYTCNYQYPSNFYLGNSSDKLVLKNSSGTEIDRVEWDGGTHWPDPDGKSMVFTGTPSDDNNDYNYWTTANARELSYTGEGDDGSPGTNGNQQTLPVTLSTFTAQYLNSKPTLYWQTQSEEDNMGWFIYRNTIEDFTSAEKISDMIPGHGTTTQPQDYIYEDAEELQIEQTYYYWLESVDYSGTIHHYDRVAQITIPPDDPGQNVTPPTAYDISADPNPFSHSTEITFAIDQISRIDVTIYNVKGQMVKSFGTVMTNADEEVSFQWNGKDNASKALTNGVYLYSVKVNGKDYATKQLILMK